MVVATIVVATMVVAAIVVAAFVRGDFLVALTSRVRIPGSECRGTGQQRGDKNKQGQAGRFICISLADPSIRCGASIDCLT